MAKSLVLDTGFWIALYEPRDQNHFHARNLLTSIEKANFSILMPWPIFYEVLRTRFVKKGPWVRQFQAHLNQLRIIPLDDKIYRKHALLLTLQYAVSGYRPICLTDMVIRLVLEDPRRKIDYFITYNNKDFVDVCGSRRIEMNYEEPA